MRSRIFRTLALLGALGGCAGTPDITKAPAPEGGQSYAQALEAMCDVDRRAGLSSEEDPITIGQRRSAWIADHVENPDGIYLRTMISVKGPEEQAVAMRAEARKVGIGRCALADAIERDGAGGISP